MAKFRNGNLVLTNSQEIIIGTSTVVSSSREGDFTTLVLPAGATINEFSIDGTLIGDSDTAVPTEKAVKTYVDSKIAGSISAGTDNHVARYDGTTGIQEASNVVIDDSDNLSTTADLIAGSGDTNVTISHLGGIEISQSGAAPYIDFKSTNAEDADCRIIQDSNGLQFLTGGNGSTSIGLEIDSSQNVSISNGTLQIEDSGTLEAGQMTPDGTAVLGYNGEFYASKVHNSVWNDVADYQKLAEGTEYVPGKCYYDTLEGAKICTEKCQKSVIGILSDTFGFGIGKEFGANKAPFGIAGWVLAFVDGDCEPGDTLTSNEYGNLAKMEDFEKTRFPERIVAIYKKPEEEEFWGPPNNKIDVKGRHWVKVK